jgi:AcrR family transcriptional regulator
MSVSTGSTSGERTRREQLLAIAARLFAERGFKNTTVRDIADAAGILSGSLYHHFDSKESMVDEILSTFQEELFGHYDAILAAPDLDPLAKLEQAVLVSFDAIDRHRDEVAIYQNDAAYLLTFERFAYLGERSQQSREVWLTLLRNGIDAGLLRDDLDLELTYRFIRDTIWVAVSWYRPGGRRTHTEIARQYLTILLEGVSETSRSRSDRLETPHDESETQDA